jgi:hypothetical protein
VREVRQPAEVPHGRAGVRFPWGETRTAVRTENLPRLTGRDGSPAAQQRRCQTANA